ncbi:MAG: hypothetical protein QOJ59_1103 [Thermomicrobiales bacterium]|nr:hypothetical protein [Thermomicrobiales bacterium]
MLSRYGRRLIAPIGAVLLLALVALGGSTGVIAQDGTPAAEEEGRPAHIHTGTCPEIGDVVQPLTNLTAPEGDTVGQETALQAEYSYTLVPLSLDAILAEDHAINVHESMENIGNYIACGDIGGVVDANGQLVVGLAEVNDSGFTGIAFLAPNADDPNSTDVSTFIAPTGAGGGGGTTGGGDDATPTG